MKKTGELLKQKRESASLSLSEVALATKINPKILNAIESGDQAHLPAKTFLKGFVRSYAIYLRMDTEEVMRTFTEETGGPATQPVHEAYQKQAETAGARKAKEKVDDEGGSGLRTAAVVVIVVLIGLIIGVRELIEKYQREKVVVTEVKVTPIAAPPLEPQPAQPSPQAQEKAPEQAQAASEPEKPGEKPAEKPAEKPVEKPTDAPVAGIPAVLAAPKAESEKPKAEKLPADVPKAADGKTPPVEVKPEDVKSEPVITAESKPPAGAKAARQEIILEALDNVEVRFSLRGESKRVSLAPTQVHTIQADGSLTLDVSDGGAVNIIVNGHELGPAGALGKAKQVTVP